jgi:hypothetical protein
MTLPTILLASFVFLSWIRYSFSILTNEEPYLLISVMIHSLATQAAYVLVGGCGMWVLIYLRRSAEYGSDAALPL